MDGSDPLSYIKAIGQGADSSIDLAGAALAFGLLGHPGLHPERYTNHLNKLVRETAARHASLLAAGAEDDLPARLAALKHVLAEANGYQGDRVDYNNIQNADLIRVIDRRKGMPISLGILYIHAARGQGWAVDGLNIPGHFAFRMEKEGRVEIVDPFNACSLLKAPDLRALIKGALGPRAELSADYYRPMTNREMLIRLQNNIKLRQVEAEDYAGALATVEAMRLIDPAEFRLLLDAGVLYARTGQPAAAAAALEGYIENAPDPRDRHDAALLLRQIQDSLN